MGKLALLAIGITLLMGSAGTISAFESPLPIVCPEFKWFPDPVVDGFHSPFFWNGDSWTIVDYSKYHWLFKCKIPPFEPEAKEVSVHRVEKVVKKEKAVPVILLPETGGVNVRWSRPWHKLGWMGIR